MPKTKKPKRKVKQKPGPQEERLIIKGDPLKAVDALLKKQPTPSR